jgi:1-deoxy-D-xylulose-5-phosphate reductoisomerase
MRQKVLVLGSTGSIGVNTLDVIDRHPDRFEVFALCAGRQVDALLGQCARHKPAFATLADPLACAQLAERIQAEGLPTVVLQHPQAQSQLAAHAEVDMVMAAIVGAAGLSPCLAAAEAGKRILLANKEALVVGGDVFLNAVRSGGAHLLPIDSEHSAIFQSLPEDPLTWQDRVERVILTASGGPFRTLAPDLLHQVTPQQACKHPNWKMGAKISVDSATMMNKALEVIEAHYLFGMSPQQLEVVIHPQSIVHSMVQYKDGSVVAQLGNADMRVPIAYGLSWPHRIESGTERLDFSKLSALTFEPATAAEHRERFPCLSLAWQALQGPQGSCAVLNAANEVAVAAFLSGQIRFDQIAIINTHLLEQHQQNWAGRGVQDLEAVLQLDQRTRQSARALLDAM